MQSELIMFLTHKWVSIPPPLSTYSVALTRNFCLSFTPIKTLLVFDKSYQSTCQIPFGVISFSPFSHIIQMTQISIFHFPFSHFSNGAISLSVQALLCIIMPSLSFACSYSFFKI